MHKYLPHSEKQIQEMLDKIGVNSINDLFSDVPQSVIKEQINGLMKAKSEQEILSYIKDIAEANEERIIFTGGGVYDVYTPAAIPSLVSRQEFLTAYTPYQPEISQGTLQYIFEYQSLICELTGLDVANASLYDGPTSASEAMFIATSQTKKKVIAVSSTLNPRVIDVIKTYAKFRSVEIKMIDSDEGRTSIHHFQELNDGTLSGVITASPNYYGLFEDNTELFKLIHEKKGLAISYVNPLTLSIFKTPKEMDADIAIGDGQVLGIPLNFGGPYIGFMAAKETYMRKIPGRIVGVSKDSDGKRCFVLTLQAREQHIRREKAVSNICSNESLMALWVTIYASLYGKKGLQDVCKLNIQGSHYLYSLLLTNKHFQKVYDDDFFNEFVVKTDLDYQEIEKALNKENFTSGIYLGDNKILFTVTEKRTPQQIQKFVKVLGGVK